MKPAEVSYFLASHVKHVGRLHAGCHVSLRQNSNLPSHHCEGVCYLFRELQWRHCGSTHINFLLLMGQEQNRLFSFKQS